MDATIKETLGDLSQEQALDLCRRLWREPVRDLKIVAGRILARKRIEPDAEAWDFVTERLIDLDGWAVVDNLATRRAASSKTPAGSTSPKAWIDNPHLWTARGARLHPALGEGGRRPRTDARPGRATGGGFSGRPSIKDRPEAVF